MNQPIESREFSRIVRFEILFYNWSILVAHTSVARRGCVCGRTEETAKTTTRSKWRIRDLDLTLLQRGIFPTSRVVSRGKSACRAYVVFASERFAIRLTRELSHAERRGTRPTSRRFGFARVSRGAVS